MFVFIKQIDPFSDEHQNSAIGNCDLRDVYNQSDKNVRDHFAMHPEEVPWKAGLLN